MSGSTEHIGDAFGANLVDFEHQSSVEARATALRHLGKIGADKRERADQQLKDAILAFVRDARYEAKAPAYKSVGRLEKIVKHACKLDQLITGGRAQNFPAEPLPEVRSALTAPSARETGTENIAALRPDGVSYHEDAPVVAAIEAVRAI